MTDDQQSSAVVPAPSNKMSFGQGSARPEDLLLPRVKVAQQMSKEVADQRANAGDFFNTLTGENYGPTLRIQPIHLFMQRIFLVRQERREAADKLLKAAKLPELSEGDGLKCRSFDMFVGRGEPGIDCNDCPLSKWTPGPKGQNQPPPCTETYNVAASNEIGELLIVSFSKSSAKIGKRFNSILRMTLQAPWTRFYDLATRAERNDRGNWFVPDFAVSPEKPDMALIEQAARWAQRIEGAVINVTPVEEDEGLDGSNGSVTHGSVDTEDPDNPF